MVFPALLLFLHQVVLEEVLDTQIIDTAHQQQQQQQPANAQRKWGFITANLMVCLFVIAMIIRRSGTMIDNNTNKNDTFGVDGSLITTNNNTTKFPGPVGDDMTTDGMTPGQPFFSWKSWGYGVVRDYWDQKKDDWIEIEDELHRKVCRMLYILLYCYILYQQHLMYLHLLLYSNDKLLSDIPYHTLPCPALHTVSFSSLFVSVFVYFLYFYLFIFYILYIPYLP